MKQGLESLNELQQEIVYLFFYKDLSQTEIGKRLSLPYRCLDYEISQVEALPAPVDFYSVE